MKNTLKWFLMIGLSLMLSACITEYSPVDDVVQLKSGESQTFEVTSDNPIATLTWYLDGKEVNSDTNQYTFTAEENSTDHIIVHVLVVKEKIKKQKASNRFMKMPSDLEDFVTWTINVLPDNVDTYTFYLDSDQDGYGDPGSAIEVEDPEPPERYVENDDDCDDTNAAVNPAAEEVCDEVDNNCNGEIDEGCPGETYTFYRDSDQDGYGDPGNSIEGTDPTPPDGYVGNNTDCDDANAAVNPGAEEICDEVDNNCNGQIDEGCPSQTYTFYRDSDQDGYGDPDNSIEGTDPTPPDGYVGNNTDCDDANAAVNPGAEEVCDEVDNNCNGEADEGVTITYYADNDSDGYGNAGDTTQACSASAGYVEDNTDCDDANAAVNPGAEEVCDEVDNNCNGETDEGVITTYYADNDSDGYGNADDSTQACSASAGYVEDNTDCDDANAAINPGAEEVCDEVDNNCNGEADEGVTITYYADNDSDGYGNADDTTQACSASAGYVEDNTDCDDTNAAVYPGAEEIDDDIDNDCDGEIDEDIMTIPSPPANVSATDIDSGLTYIAVTWDASEGATYYNVYRAIWEEDAEYELLDGNIAGTSYDYVQDWQTDVYDIIGPNPAMAPDADEAARAAFVEALEAYREQAQPVLLNFKAPAYFKIQACNDLGCSDMSDFDAGQAEFIHTATESEVAQLVIPAWGYPNLKALADSPPGTQALGWCGIDICGSVEGMVMGRLDLSGLPQIDVYYENYVDGWDLHPNARFWADGYIGGEQKLIPSSQGVVEVSGEFDVSLGAMNAHMFVYSYIGGTTGNENDGYISITYNGETYQYTLPVQPVAGEDYADAPVPVDPARNDADYTISRRETDYPVPFSEEPNTDCDNWSDDKIVNCNRVP